MVQLLLLTDPYHALYMYQTLVMVLYFTCSSEHHTYQSESTRDVTSEDTRLQSFHMTSNICLRVQNMAIISQLVKHLQMNYLKTSLR